MGEIIVPNDPAAAVLQIIGWVSYPSHLRFRDRGILALQDWARSRLGLPVVGLRTRTDLTLRRLEHILDKHMLSGEIFRRQVLMRQYNDGFFGQTSTRAFARRTADFYAEIDEGNAIRDNWTKAKPILHLASGICHGMARRPSLEALVFSNFSWAMTAVEQSEKLRKLAVEVRHPLADQLMPIEISS